ncbi:MAG: ABC transporter permease [Spirochaetia bacterium]
MKTITTVKKNTIQRPTGLEERRKLEKFKAVLPLHLMLLPAVILLAIYEYFPMVGLTMAFQDFIPNRGFFGSPWVGLDNFEYMFKIKQFRRVIFNTFFISTMKIVVKTVVPIILALLLNEVGKSWFKRSVQTITYLPHFLSWVILGGIILDFASPVSGALNKFIEMLGGEPIYFFGEAALFPYMVVATDLWRDLGFSTIIFLAALSSVDPNLYEAAIVDGAGRWKQTWHISLPAMMPIVMLSTILSLGIILKAGFAQILNLYSPMVYSTGDIIDTYVYRIGLKEGRYSLATAVGLFQSSVSFVLITISYWFANKFSNYRVF